MEVQRSYNCTYTKLLFSDLVKELGGDEEDFKLLLSVESTKKQEEAPESSFTDTDQQELKNLIKSLNLSKFAALSVVPDAAAEGEVKEKKDEKVEKKAKEKQKKLQDSEVSSTTHSPAVQAAVPAAIQAAVQAVVEEEPSRSGPEFHFVKTTPNRGHCVIRQSEAKWYSSATEPAAAKAETNGSEAAEVNLKYWLPKIEKYAQLAWDLELKNYEEARKKGLRTENI
jgi:hypothetical protein